jgi:uncharacterized membrane protein
MNTYLLLVSAIAASAALSEVAPSSAEESAPASAEGVALTPAQMRAGFTPENYGRSPVKPQDFRAEACYGIAAAGMNDCAAIGLNDCSGLAKINADPKQWIFVPEGYCSRIHGGSLEPK